MKRIYEFATILFLTVGTGWYGWLVIDDLMHPERWDDPLHDPRIYLPLMACVISFIAWSVWSEEKLTKKLDRMRWYDAQVKSFFDTVQRQRAEGKWEEANDTVRLYEQWKKRVGPRTTESGKN